MRPWAALAGLVPLVAAAAALAQTDPGAWSNGPRLPVARSEVSVAAIGSTIYVAGGYAAAGPHPTALDTTGKVDVDEPLVEAFDTVAGTWREVAPLPRGLNHVGLAALNGKLYAFGGFQKQNRDPVADANVYDPATNRWTALPPLGRPRGSIGVVAFDGKLHLVGGRDEHSLIIHEVFDPANARYSAAAPLPVGRDHLGLVAVAGAIYAIAGRIDDFNHNTSYVDRYDPVADVWSAMAPMPSERSGMAVAVYHGRILAIGGERGGGTFTNNEAYDPQTNTWSTLTPLPEGRHGTGAVVIGERLYIPAGGPVNGGSRQSDTLLIFTQR
ncbi:MAG TPA: kelch repeat-containing protein [Candidatus Elarobacter sp.]|jgi:N-acetylneuraminic acid mutarotase